MHQSPNLAIALLPLILILVAVGLSLLYFKQRDYSGPNGRTIVRCRQGHLYTTIWIPFMSFKAVRLGLTRFQFCPIGRHWSFVTPVRASDLTDAERRQASEYQDNQIP